MKKFLLSDIFITEPRSARTKQDPSYAAARRRPVITNPILASAKMNLQPRSARITARPVSSTPYRILDAPGVLDDYYLNILDWNQSPNHDCLAIALDSSVYLYTPATKSVHELSTVHGKYICSVSFKEEKLAVGISDGKMELYDITRIAPLGMRQIDDTRVTTVSWNGNVISAGTRSGRIINIDIRMKEKIGVFIASGMSSRTDEDGIVSKFHSAHTDEVCGLKWSPDGKYLASGGNDNLVKIWQLGNTSPRCILEGHQSAVKALAWCPWRTGILATGGGTRDKTIKFWDACSGQLERSTDVTSQVCSLNFSPRYKELISGHGYSENNLILWKVATMKQVSVFGKHESRVLSTAISGDGRSVASISGDENLKFWRILEEEKNVQKRNSINFR
ncbi:Cell division cycle protein 20 like protein [Astathelohania contejeani]|uniref:Cell division cycle protein 20 like protein n=1 Tax=Astathelohania contejeani TaxID=164912 RepID=A0ABQ7HXT1_9MICR|nr:Cell division cycle protein 20 like protein [Thelohania contejeani]